MPLADSTIIQDPVRLAALRDTGLLDAPSNPALERLTRLTRRLLGVPSAVVTLVDANRQYFAAASGLDGDLEIERETPLSHSFCQHVVATAAPLIVTDAKAHPLVHDNLAIPEYGVHAYAGMPLRTSDGQMLGSFCAFDDHARTWSAEDLATLQDLAQSAMTEIELRFTSRLLEDQGDQLRALLDHTSELVIRIAPDGVVRYANAAFRGVVGEPPARPDREWFRARLDAVSGARFAEAWTGAVERGESQDVELCFQPEGALPVEVEARLVPNVSNGQLRGVRLFGRDVTESRRVEQLKDQMIGIVSHELRTPIGAVQGSLQLLGRLLPAELGAKERELLALAQRNSARLLALVNDLLDLERLEGGRAMLDVREVPLDEVFAVARDATAPLAEQAGVMLDWQPKGARVRADADRVAQVLINLVGNAIKFTPSGSHVRIDAIVTGDAWQVRVRDEGRGIPAADLARVFDRFTQVQRSDATVKGGSGLGLAIARAIVLHHGGRIWVESVEGEGSTFAFTLPAAASVQAE